METAESQPVFDRIAVYEPGVSIGGSIPMGWMARYERLLSKGKPLDAFAAFSIGTGPDRGRRTPLWLMKLLLPRFVSADKRSKMFALLEENLLEHREVQACDDHVTAYAAIQASVLIMKGGRTGIRWVDVATAELAAVLPVSKTIQFPQFDHFGIDQQGPEEVAATAAQFFLT